MMMVLAQPSPVHREVDLGLESGLLYCTTPTLPYHIHEFQLMINYFVKGLELLPSLHIIF